MKRLLPMACDKIRIHGVVWALGVLIALVGAGEAAAEALPSIAFYYGDHPPVRQLACFDRIIVESAYLSAGELQTLQSRGGRVLAYVSVGEAEPWRSGYERMSRTWFLGRNVDWDSDITDLSNPEYRRFLLDNRFQPLWDRGFRAFFLDTLDSYVALDARKLDRQAQQSGLVELVRGIKLRFPACRLIANRGFEVLDRIHGLIDGVAAESLYCAWDPHMKSYIDVAERDRRWLTEQLRRARDAYHLEVYSVDYLPAGQRVRARQIARKIADLGISPWVTVPRHDVLGMGLREFMPRNVLVLYDDDTGRAEIEQMAVLLDYYGYVAVYQHTHNLPAYRLAGRCAGLITCLHAPQSPAYARWLQRQAADGLRVLILAYPGFGTESTLFKSFGLEPVATAPPFRVMDHDALYGFEARMDTTAADVDGLRSVDGANNVHLRVGDRSGTVLTPVVTGPWGGLAMSPWAYYDGAAEKPRWVVEPFELVKTALALPPIPMPDVTTENGQRVWMSHIDGDGFINRAELPGTPLAAEVIRTRILEKYRYPITVSIIEGEIGPQGLHPQLSAEAETVARKIFRMPTVEAASHTFSHPFDWQKVQQGEPASGEYSLPIKGYRYSLEREIRGSVDYMNKSLLPRGKTADVLFWSGNCLPTVDALRLARAAGLLNMNGGETVIRKEAPYLFNVTPMARPVDDELQIYAPIMNENVYTNLWQGPFYGFRRVIETFELTDQPRRLKPIDIYYHFYSGEKTAALRALRTVYDWTLKQQILPLFTSEYIQRVLACRQAMVFRELSGTLEYIAPAALRTLRLTGGACTLDLSTADNVAGYRRLHDGTYFALSGGTRTRLKPGAADNRAVRLVRANGILDAWHRQADGVRVSMHGHRPLEVVVDGPGTCSIMVGGRALPAVKTGEGWRFEMDGLRLKGARIVCR